MSALLFTTVAMMTTGAVNSQAAPVIVNPDFEETIPGTNKPKGWTDIIGDNVMAMNNNGGTLNLTLPNANRTLAPTSVRGASQNLDLTGVHYIVFDAGSAIAAPTWVRFVVRIDGNEVWSASQAGIYEDQAIDVSGYVGVHTLSFRIESVVSQATFKPAVITASFSFDNLRTALPDSTPPVLALPGNLVVEATGPSGAVATYTASANDDTDGSVAVNLSPSSGSMFPLGTTTVNASATDAAGNKASGSFTVTVRDTTPPVLSLPSSGTVEATGPGGAAVTFSGSASDIVSGAVAVNFSPASGSTFPLGTTTVNASATDAAGNTANGSFTVTVRDTTAPVLSLPASAIVEATGPGGAVVTFSGSASDIVSGAVAVNFSPASGSTFPLGTTTVNASATDAAGNTASGSFTVTVRDTTAPVITSLAASPAVLWPPNHKMVSVSVTGNATEAVSEVTGRILSVTSNEPDNGLGDGDTAGDIVITSPGTVSLRAERAAQGNGRIYTILFEVRDAAGNASTRTTTVSVPKSQGK